ncbi:polyketide synthase [Aspergillus cavernicola]|uniref:Polyketide synthase n=1 Tax=Aspergillus cavernicola TaxID=176166 RepID=A0ABR4J505_9EURO
MPGLEGIAIIGYSFKFPSGVEDDLSFWEVLQNRRNLKSDWPSSRLDLDSSVSNGYCTIPSQAGHYITEDVRSFDAPFFSVTAKEAASMDPLQRWTLEVSYRALETAGIPAEKLTGSRTAVFAASMLEDYARMNAMDPDNLDRFAATGNAVSCMIPNRISWYFDLRGPSIHVNTACSSSLSAIDMACKTLHSGDSNCAIVTGSNLLLDPAVFHMLSSQNFLSPDGLCYSFDHRANGYARGEGIIAIVLKPVSTAVQDGDMIRAVIRGTGSNQDGRTPVLTQPSLQSQEDLIRHVYHQADLPLDKTRYVEAHGERTVFRHSMGVLTAARDRNPCSLLNILFMCMFANYTIGKILGRSLTERHDRGSVKANIGHLEGASGLASLVKAILILEKGIIPPNALFEKINPAIDAQLFHIVVPTESVAWPNPGLRRISVNSFGFGGSNSHIILDDALHYLQYQGLAGRHCTIAKTPSLTETNSYASGIGHTNSEAHDDLRTVHNNEFHHNGITNGNVLPCSNGIDNTYGLSKLLVWTAADEKTIHRLIQAYIPFYRDALSSSHERINRLAYTLSTRRGRMLWRSFAVSQGDKIISPAKALRSSAETGLVFVFTGQGAQYAKMGLKLLEYSVFTKTMEQIDAIYKSFGCVWSLFDELRHSDNIDKPEYSQTLCTAVQIGLVELLKSFGVVAKAVLGHSSGEIAAAYTNGALSLKSACKVAYFRGKLAEKLRVQNLTSPGAMISINMAENQVSGYLENIGATGLNLAVCIACVNSPLNCTLSGPEWAIDAVKAQADADGIFAQKLRTGVPYHSSYMQVISEEYLSLMGELEGARGPYAPPVPMVSSVSAQPINQSVLATARYWVDNMVSPVRFSNAVQYLAEQQTFGALGTVTDFVEIGPHPALRRPVQDTLSHVKSEIRYLNTLHRSQSAIKCILELAGRLFCLGYPVCIKTVNQQDASLPFLVDCPPYPFNRLPFWAESRLSRDFRLRGSTCRETLGVRVSDWNPLEPRWRNFFSVESHPWIGHHKISDTILYPAAGMLVITMEAVHQMVPNDRSVIGYLFKRADFISPIIVPESWAERVETQVHVQQVRQPGKLGADTGEFDVSIFSYSQGHWSECYRAKIQVEYEEVSRFESVRTQHKQASELCTYPVDSGALYRDAADHGLQYGDWFRLLQNVFWDSERTAVSRVDITPKHRTARLVHPAILDQAFHVLRVAAGQIPAANVPVRISDAWFAASGWQKSRYIRMVSTATSNESGSGEQGSIFALGENDLVLCSVKSAVTAAVSGKTGSKKEEKQLLYSVEWKPQLSLLVPEQLQNLYGGRASSDETSIVADHAMLCDTLNLVTARTLALIDQQKVPAALKEHVKWMERHVRKRLTPIQRREAVTISKTELENQLSKVESVLPAWTLYTTCARKLSQILAGEIDPLQVVFESDQARIFYAHLFQTLCADGRLAGYLDLAAHENPALRILEVGAGTGGMTGHVLAALQEREARTGAPSFATYTYTDISPAFFEQALLRWPELQAKGRLTFSVLNLDKSLASQGLSLGSYDIVIAGSVLHATPDLEATIRNVRTALTPGGHLILLEAVNPDNVATNFMAGLVPGWWVAREVWRRHSAAVSEPLWDQCLRANGFSGSDLVLRDYNSDECHNMSIITTTAIAPNDTVPQLPKPQLVLVIDESQQQQELATLLSNYLNRCGWSSIICVFGLGQLEHEKWSSDVIVVCIAEINNRPLVASLTEEAFTCLKRLTRHKQLLWVTGTSINDSQYPGYGAVHGLLRCIRAEQVDSHIVTLAMEDESNAASCAHFIEKALVVAFRSLSKEVEYIVRDGLLMTGRAVKDTTGQTALRALLKHKPRVEVAVAHSSLNGVIIDPPLVEIDAYTCGLNSSTSSRLVPGDSAGVVTRVGSACDTIRPGDQVVLVAAEGLGQHARAQEKNTIKIPKSLSLESATLLLIPGLTAYYALVELARIRPGDRVLIHSAFGDIGQIAIRIARMCGAQVFATALLEKKQFVVDMLGIAEDRIFFIDTTSFKPSLRRAAQYGGFDVVLSNLADGDGHLRTLLECIAPGAQVVVVGGTNDDADRALPIADYPRNISFSLFDPVTLCPTVRARVIDKVMRLIEEDVIKLTQLASETSMSISMESAVDGTGTISTLTKPWTFSQNASYLIVGGSGGLGRAIMRWMADRRAKNIILLSRSGASSKAAASIMAELRTRGVNIVAFACDASSESNLASVLDDCTRSMPPIKGCINAAMVLQDAIFQDSMTFTQWESTMRSKVQTSWNLHRLLPSNLDFFILLSSLLGVTGQMASSNYAAGCTFQDALVRYRTAHGQKALSLDLGWMRDIGIIAETAAYQRQRHATDDMQPIDARELLALLDMCLHPQSCSWQTPQQARGQVLFGLRTPVDILQERKRPPPLLDQPFFAPFAYLPGGADPSGTDGQANVTEIEVDAASRFQQSVDPRDRAQVVFRALAAKLARSISISPDDVEPSKALSGYGVDSLMAVELRNWIVREFEAPVAIFDIMGEMSIAGIAEMVVQKSAMEIQGS